MRGALIEMLAEQALADVAIGALAERAGVGYATFFRHYRDKEALLADIADALIADLLVRMVPFVLAGDGLAAFHALAATVEESRGLCHALLTGAGDAMRHTITERAIAQSMAAPDTSPSWLPRELAVTHMVGAVLTILTWWLEREPSLSTDDMAAILHRLVLAPVMSDRHTSS
ncbi:MAG: helix-turn-helix domain containing protein [Sphingomonas phyllosphaerae]|uniref:TetR/AcrR family transcriptional regulator n=1 Tax=Sphingomonas phyllosphaerae TaxID=257003 RepID=UPI002FFA661A